jgi:5-methyltetrahydrofolate--homocysteine methyltransferase
MLTTAYGSAGIALAAATAMLLITSRSLILTMFSTLTVAFVLCSVTATLVSLGWTLGFLESICFAILIGISCDFVLHFAHSYASLEGDRSREERTKYAIIHMGPSILAAAFTTMASAIIMNFTVITFFQKFGLILLMTVIQATGASFLIFCALNLCFGPTNPTYLYDKVVAKLCTKSTPSSFDKDDDGDEESNLGETTRTNDTTATPKTH